MKRFKLTKDMIAVVKQASLEHHERLNAAKTSKTQKIEKMGFREFKERIEKHECFNENDVKNGGSAITATVNGIKVCYDYDSIQKNFLWFVTKESEADFKALFPHACSLIWDFDEEEEK